MLGLYPARQIRYVFSENFVERIIEADCRVLSVDKFRRSPADPSPQELAERVVDCPVVDLRAGRSYNRPERRVSRPITGATAVEFDECWQEVYS